MGESIVDAPNYGDKMGEATASGSPLQVSVSFGRFESDSLSWERWSTFSPNKYQEELEKCATPGSVAKKKAYFEAHYKKIAAKKAEQLDQHKRMEITSPRTDDQDSGVPDKNPSGRTSNYDICNCPSSDQGGEREANLINEASGIHIDGPGEDVPDTTASKGSVVEEVTGMDSGSTLDGVGLDKPVEPDMAKVKEENEEEEHKEEERKSSSQRSESINDFPPIMNDVVADVPQVREKLKVDRSKEAQKSKLSRPKESQKLKPDHLKESPKVKPDRLKEPQKGTSVNKGSNVAKNKPASPITKISPVTTPKVSKTPRTSTVLSASQFLTKKPNSTSLQKSKNPTTGQSKNLAPKSLHMSLSLGPPNSDPASLSATRKSLIMEKMGDKDIVKRAFRTFQNSFNQLRGSGEEKSSAAKQGSTKKMETKVSNPSTPQKLNGGSLKAVGLDKKVSKAAASFGKKSDGKTDKQKECQPFKKSEKKANNTEAERSGLQSKPKEEKETDIGKIRQSPNLKATPMPTSCREQKVSRSSLSQGGSRKEIHQ